MKKIVTIIILSFIITGCYKNSIELTKERYKKAGVQLKIPDEMVPVKLVKQEDSSYDLAYQFKNNNNYELRIGLYPDDFLEGINTIDDNKELMTALWGISCATGYNIAGNGDKEPNISFFPVPDVFQEFGADLGTSNTVLGNSDFAGKYKIIQINSFYRKGRNYVVVYHLITDIDEYAKIWKTKEYIKAFHCIRYE